MKLQTQIPLQKRTENLIDYNSKVVLVGSCFVENIGQKLSYFKFQNFQNPFGVLFHPKAIETLIVRALQKKAYEASDVFFHNEQWHCFDAHSQMSHASKSDLLNNLNAQLEQTRKELHAASHIIVTLGTAWVYKQRTFEKHVANCHKLPQHNFSKELLSISEISQSLQTLIREINAVNPLASIIFTVSPIRHIKDGFIQNTQSKAHLITAIHNILQTADTSQNFYFPSYELLMDELRDYRFYTEDMVHPNATAITYIWEKFQTVWMSSAAEVIMLEVDTIQKGLAHRPFHPTSEKHLNFLQHLELKKEHLMAKFDHITF